MSAQPFRFTSKLVKVPTKHTLPDLKLRSMLLDNSDVVVGLPAGKIHKPDPPLKAGAGKASPAPKPVSLATIGAAHEFGVPSLGIPERPWLRPGVRSGIDDYRRLNAINVLRVLRGEMTAVQALKQLGAMAVGKVQKFIRAGAFQALKQSTIDRKGSSAPLIDSGQMIQSITSQIIKKGDNK